MKVHIFTITYNEEVMLPQFISYYRKKFPNCKITVMDNESTDNTVELALKNNCEVLTWSSNNEIRDDMYLFIKNDCWKKSDADWIIVVDCDEFIDINEDILKITPFNIYKAVGYDMMGNSLNINEIDSGVRSPGYDKICLFRKDTVKEINYEPGCHNANPVVNEGEELLYNKDTLLFHYKWLTYDYVIERYKMFAERLSDINKKYQWGIHYTFDESVHREYYERAYNTKVKVRNI